MISPLIRWPISLYHYKDLKKFLGETLLRFPVFDDNGKLIEHDLIVKAWSFLVTGDENKIKLTITPDLAKEEPNFPQQAKEDPNFLQQANYLLEKDEDICYKLMEDIGGNRTEIDYLSSGKNQLLFLCLILFGMRATGSIILLDEPELHLSPQAVARLNVLLGVSVEFAKNQFIIATHHPSMAIDSQRGINYKISSGKAMQLLPDEISDFFEDQRYA